MEDFVLVEAAAGRRSGPHASVEQPDGAIGDLLTTNHDSPSTARARRHVSMDLASTQQDTADLAIGGGGEETAPANVGRLARPHHHSGEPSTGAASDSGRDGIDELGPLHEHLRLAQASLRGAANDLVRAGDLQTSGDSGTDRSSVQSEETSGAGEESAVSDSVATSHQRLPRTGDHDTASDRETIGGGSTTGASSAMLPRSASLADLTAWSETTNALDHTRHDHPSPSPQPPVLPYIAWPVLPRPRTSVELRNLRVVMTSKQVVPC